MFHAKETVRISKQSRLWGEIAYVPSVPQCREVGNILAVGIRVLVYDRKKEAGEHTTSTTLPGFSIGGCVLRTIFRKIDTTLSHLV